jgi:hypothetical protein
MLAFILILGLCIKLVESSGGAGKVAFWSLDSIGNKATKDYQTKSVDSKHVTRFLEENSGKYEKIVLLKSQDSSSVLSAVGDVFVASHTRTVMSSVHNSDLSSESIREQILATESFQDHKKVSMDDLMKEFSTTHESSRESKVDTYEVTLDTKQDITSFFADMKQRTTQSPTLWIAVEESSLVAESGRRLEAVPGHYSRILATTSSNMFYEPEGTEFSIYYADTYLYITPDIFTGLMTGLFVFFVLLVGLSCLGNIQGMNNFVDKLPVVGREA